MLSPETPPTHHFLLTPEELRAVRQELGQCQGNISSTDIPWAWEEAGLSCREISFPFGLELNSTMPPSKWHLFSLIWGLGIELSFPLLIKSLTDLHCSPEVAVLLNNDRRAQVHF